MEYQVVTKKMTFSPVLKYQSHRTQTVINQLQLYKINLCENKRTKDMTFSLLLNKPNSFY